MFNSQQIDGLAELRIQQQVIREQIFAQFAAVQFRLYLRKHIRYFYGAYRALKEGAPHFRKTFKVWNHCIGQFTQQTVIRLWCISLGQKRLKRFEIALKIRGQFDRDFLPYPSGGAAVLEPLDG